MITLTEFKEALQHLTINPISLLFYGACIGGLWLVSSEQTPERFKAGVAILGCLILLRSPFPLELKEPKPKPESEENTGSEVLK